MREYILTKSGERDYELNKVGGRKYLLTAASVPTPPIITADTTIITADTTIITADGGLL